MANRWWILLAALGATTATAAAQTSSLYQQSAQQATSRPAAGEEKTASASTVRSMVAAPAPPKKKFTKNDLITIVVAEQASHSSSAQTTADRDAKIDAQMKAMIDLQSLANKGQVKASNFSAGTPAITGESKTNLDATGANTRTDTMDARIEGRIVDIRPNGNLVIEASKKITTDEESYTINVSGVCRTEDVVLPLCTIQSTQISELTIVKNSTGMVKDATGRTWFEKLFSKINPF